MQRRKSYSSLALVVCGGRRQRPPAKKKAVVLRAEKVVVGGGLCRATATEGRVYSVSSLPREQTSNFCGKVDNMPIQE